MVAALVVVAVAVAVAAVAVARFGLEMGKILLVEDNEMNRDMLSRRLERKEFEVVIAVDGQAGVNMATSDGRFRLPARDARQY